MKRILKHVGGKDFRKTHQRKLDEQRALYLEEREKEIQEQQYLEELKRLSSPFKSDWRSEIDSEKMDEINEGMTISGLLYAELPATGDVDLSTTEVTSADVFADGPYELNIDRGEGGTYPALVGASVRSSGSGTGIDGGFDVGSHVAFDGAGSTDGARWAIFQAVDSTEYDTIVFSVIRGNDSNGGEDPDAEGEELYFYYKMPDMGDYIPITAYPTVDNYDNYEGGTSRIVPTGNDTAGVVDYQLYIPSYARGPGARFMMYQFNSNESQGDNYGITKISFRRRAPVNVFVSLDSPEATSFIRTSPIMQGLSAEGRRKKLEDMLNAGDEYLLKQLGMQGSMARPANTFAQRDWTSAAYGLPANYKERLVQANAYFQKNVGSIPVSLGLHGGGSSDRMAELRRQSFKKVGFTDNQIDAIERNNLLQTKFDSSKQMSGVKSSLPAYDPNVSLNRTNVNVDSNTFQKIVAQQKYQQDLAAYEKAVAADKQKSDNLSKAVDAARAEYLKSGQSVAQRQQSYDKLQAAIKAGTDHAKSTLKNPITKPEPPATQTPQSKLTPQQLADIDKQIKELEAAAEKSKQDAKNKQWRAVAELGLDIATAAAFLSPAPGDEAAILAARAASKTGPAAARGFAKANPGRYNPFLSDKANKYFNFKNSYELQGQVISEKKLKSPKEVANKIPGYYDGKPAPLGFPDNPPPTPVGGFHPDLVDGKKVADRFNRLDPQSAQAMPPTGNPHIDKKVRAAAKKPK